MGRNLGDCLLTTQTSDSLATRGILTQESLVMAAISADRGGAEGTPSAKSFFRECRENRLRETKVGG